MELWYGKLLLQYDELNKNLIKFLFAYNKSQIQSCFKKIGNND